MVIPLFNAGHSQLARLIFAIWFLSIELKNEDLGSGVIYNHNQTS